MSGSALADKDEVVSAVCSSFGTEEGQRLKQKLQHVARQQGKKRKVEEKCEVTNRQHDSQASSTSRVMNGAESPFLPGWSSSLQRQPYTIATPVLSPAVPSPSHNTSNYEGNEHLVDPQFYQLFGTGFYSKQHNTSLPVQLPYQQQGQQLQQQQQPQQPHPGINNSYTLPTSRADNNLGPVNSFDARKNLISDGKKDKNDIYNFQGASKNVQSQNDVYYQSGVSKSIVSNGDDHLTAAHNAMLEKSGLLNSSRQLSSPFTPVQNHHFQPIKSPVLPLMPNGYTGSHSRSSTPQFHQNTNSFETFKSAGDFRPENRMSSPHTDEHAKSANFWSQFGFPPPNVKDGGLSRPSSRNSSGTNEGSQYGSQTEKLMPKPKTTKVKRQKSVPLDPQTQNQTLPGHTSEKKKEVRYSRKKKEEDPGIKELVDAKVQEIMKACRVKMGQTNANENNEHRSSNSICSAGNENSIFDMTGDQLSKAFTSANKSDISYSFRNESQKLPNQLCQLSQSYNSAWEVSSNSQGTLHYKPPSTSPQGFSRSVLSEQVDKMRSVRKEMQSPTSIINASYDGYKSSNNNNSLSALNEQITDLRNSRRERHSPSGLGSGNINLSNLTEQINDVRNTRKERLSPLNIQPDYSKLSALTEQIADVRNTRKERQSPVNLESNSNNLSSLSEQVADVRTTRKERRSPTEKVQGSIPCVEENEFVKSHSSLSKPAISEGSLRTPNQNCNYGRMSPCCGDCAKAGVKYSANCQSSWNKEKAKDPYNFNVFEEEHQQLLKEYELGKFRKPLDIKLVNRYSEKVSSSKDVSISEDQFASDRNSTSSLDSVSRQLINSGSAVKDDDKNRQHELPSDLSFTSEHTFSYLSYPSSEHHNLSKVGLSNSATCISSNAQSKNTTTLPKFSSTWGSGHYSNSEWPQRECPSVQERSKLPPASAANLKSINSGPVKVKGKPGRKPKKEKLLQNQANTSKRPLAEVLNLVPNSLSLNSSIAKTSLRDSISECSVMDKSVNKFSESIFLNSSLEDHKDMNSVNAGEESELAKNAAGGRRLPEDSGIGLEIDDEKLTPLPDGVSPEKVVRIKEQIENLKALVTGDDDVNARLANNRMVEVPKCDCLGPNGIFNENVEGPYYTHLGAARSVKAIREIMEKRTGTTGKAIRIEKVRYTGKEGKSSQGCPIAKWIIRRSGPDEKYLCVVRHRAGHFCETAWLMVCLIAWEGVPAEQADDLYSYLCNTLPKNGFETERRCGTNERKTCACQGVNLTKRGASFSFGCSWSMYFNGCKFARSRDARKFKLKDVSKETEIEEKLQKLATQVGPLYAKMAPTAHYNQTYYSDKASACRLGGDSHGPFSGVTACVDFCAHAHKDIHNMNNGSTVVVTLTKHRGFSKPDDEQLHVLPLYVMETTDENDSYDGQCEKIANGSLEVLHRYALEARTRSQPLLTCKKRQAQAKKDKKLSPGRKRAVSPQGGRNSPWGSSSSTSSTPKKPKVKKDPSLYSHDSNQSLLDGSQSSQAGSLAGTPVKQNSKQTKGSISHRTSTDDNRQISYNELMAYSTQAGFTGLYESFWDFFYTNGVFPPSSFLSSYRQSTLQTEREKVEESFKESKESKTHAKSNLPVISQNEDMISSSVSSNNIPVTSIADNRVPIIKSGDSALQQPTQNISESAMNIYNQESISGFNKSSTNPFNHPWNKMAATHENLYPSEQRTEHNVKPLDVHKNGYIIPNENLKTQSMEIGTRNMSDSVSYPNKGSHGQVYQKQLTPVDNSVRTQKEVLSGCQPNQTTFESKIPLDTFNTSVTTSVEANKTEIQRVPDLNPNTQHQAGDGYVLDLSGSGNFKDLKNTKEEESVQENFGNSLQSISDSAVEAIHKNINLHSGSVEERAQLDPSHSPNKMTDVPTDQSRFVKSMENSPPDHSKQADVRNAATVNDVLDQKLIEQTMTVKGNSQTDLPQSVACPNPVFNSPGNSFPPNSVLPSLENQLQLHSNLALAGNRTSISQAHNTSGNSKQHETISSEIKITNPFDSPSKESEPQKFFQMYNSGMYPKEWFNFGQSRYRSSNNANVSISAQNSGESNICVAAGLGTTSQEDQKLCLNKANENSQGSSEVRAQGNAQNAPNNKASQLWHANTNTNSFDRGSIKATIANASEMETSPDFASPLHLLSEAVEIRSKDMNNSKESRNGLIGIKENQNKDPAMNTLHYSAYQSEKQSQNYKIQNRPVHQSDFSATGRADNQSYLPQRPYPVDGKRYTHDPNLLACKEQLPFGMSTPHKLGLNEDEEDPKIDPTVVKCEMEYNENAFQDPFIGGVAVALSHGAVLFEVAKRELHATTGLRHPDRYQPTRISLVFYQHKNLNYEDHGWHVYAKKLEDMKQQRIEKMRKERGMVDMEEIENSFKGGKKKKKTDGKDEKEEEKIDFSKTSAAQYKFMWDCNVKHGLAQTTNTVTSKWINPEPMVSGPYQKWV